MTSKLARSVKNKNRRSWMNLISYTPDHLALTSAPLR